MASNNATGTKPELLLARALFSRRHRYRKNGKKVFEKPECAYEIQYPFKLIHINERNLFPIQKTPR
ncbi:MAG: hypothetical protein IPH28_08250 [Cytophagaceae bacterium]|nr:hypothetical protein [Cytophagaceae bacterium]